MPAIAGQTRKIDQDDGEHQCITVNIGRSAPSADEAKATATTAIINRTIDILAITASK